MASLRGNRLLFLFFSIVNVSLIAFHGMICGGGVPPEVVSALRNDLRDRENRVASLTLERDRLQIVAARSALPCPTTTVAPSVATSSSPYHEGRRSLGDGNTWLIIGIPTVPRPDGSDYLSEVLTTLDHQMSGIFENRVKIVVMNNRPGKHSGFTRAKKAFANNENIVFTENTKKYEDTPVPTREEFADSDKERPDFPVRRQTLDVAALLDYVHGQSQYFLFYEDDFLLCENAILALDYMTRKANRYLGLGGWTAIRCSFGLNGIVLHNSPQRNDVLQFHRYLMEHFSRRPPDHLIVEWYAKESQQAQEYFGSQRHVVGFRYNIARHIGRVSTLRGDAPWAFPGCFHELIAPQVFPVEAWNPVDCPEDDIWPCDSKNAQKSWLLWNSSSIARVSSSRIIYLEKGQVMTNKEK